MGMLAGNVNVIRIPSKRFEQVEIFLEVLNTSLAYPEYSAVLSKLILVKYERKKEINDFFSSICSNRVIWGGDKTIAEIRKSPLPARAYDITFSDRYSICVLDVEAVLTCTNIDGLALKFFNDTYLFDQNACTSPHTIIWLGDRTLLNEAKSRFWNAVRQTLDTKNYTIQTASVVDKLTYAYEQMMDGITEGFYAKDNLIYRAELPELQEEMPLSHTNCGYFNEVYISELKVLLPWMDSSKFQTISYFGINPDAISKLILEFGIKGVDRIVPVGATADFSPYWDGYNLVLSLSRNLSVK